MTDPTFPDTTASESRVGHAAIVRVARKSIAHDGPVSANDAPQTSQNAGSTRACDLNSLISLTKSADFCAPADMPGDANSGLPIRSTMSESGLSTIVWTSSLACSRVPLPRIPRRQLHSCV